MNQDLEGSLTDFLESLISLGADPAARDIFGKNILDYAIEYRFYVIAELLIEKYNLSCNINIRNQKSALFYLVKDNGFEFFDKYKDLFVRFLDSENQDQLTLLSVAFILRSKEMATRLLELGATTVNSVFPEDWKNNPEFSEILEHYRSRYMSDHDRYLNLSKNDFTILLNEERFSDHLITLSKSGKKIWIKKEFIEKGAPGLFHTLMSSGKTTLTIEDEEIFLVLLNLLYGGKYPIEVDNFKRLAQVAVEYDVLFLKEKLTAWLEHQENRCFRDWKKYLTAYPTGMKRKRDQQL